MILSVGRLAAVAISAQVGSNYGVTFRKFWRNQPPRDVRKRCAVQEQERRSASTGDDVNRRARRLYFHSLETWREEPCRVRLFLRLSRCCAGRSRACQESCRRLFEKCTPIHNVLSAASTMSYCCPAMNIDA